LKTSALCVGLLLTVAANAATQTRATLTGQHVNASHASGPLLICEYSGADAHFEILALNGRCAPYIEVGP
jgi:hypothetical protein